ncbi:alpha/beta hydrolase family protein [Actinophytocola oryzae]|uniref:Platelet-activating factor acetylhydrolase isoform II n=1 Tax=Actinophytocola oryzae TaxID=502181 RepID=A0A4R7VCM3_9PSEU|nr:lipase [Actinophytocola oryzae]TDV46853.1 platelet-activating factor acetylhydrolase isoform II [Actinophytocola oryzae]
MLNKALGLAVLAGLLTAAPAHAVDPPHLPAPTGHHPVGTTSLYLEDESRQDPWVPEAGARELMVSLWYPATSRGARRAPYMSPAESEAVLRGTGVTGVPYDALSRTRTNAYLDTTPSGGRHSLPLVVLSPGFTWPRSSLTALAEELASRGYVVAGIDHTYENFGMTFPGGRFVTCAACELDVDDFGTAAVESRAKDVSFVLDELTGPHPKWRGGTLIDPSRIAMAGSSLGGASVAETALTDPRIRAGVNLDGTMFKPLPESGLSRPFLFFSEDLCDPTWVRDWAHLTGPKQWLRISGSVHASFTDYDMLGRQIGVDLGSSLAGTRSVEIVRAYVAAFLDLHLRDRPQPPLARPAASYPEVSTSDCYS